MAGEQTQSPESAGQDANGGWVVDPVHSPQSSGGVEGQGQQQLETGTPAEALNTDQLVQGEEGQGQMIEGQEGEEEVPFHNHPRWQELMRERGEMQNNLAEIQAQVENMQRMASFYQNAYNEMVQMQQMNQPQATPGVQGQQQPFQGQQQPQQAVQAQAQPTGFQPPPLGQLPEGVLGPEIIGPDGNRSGGWDNQQQMAQYFDHRAGQFVNNALQQAYQGYIAPLQQQLQNSIRTVQTIQDMVVKQMHPDFDEVVKDTWNDVFTLDPQGNVIGVKNPALLRYFQDQPIPQLAAYQHGLSKKAPQKIKEGTQKATQQALSKLGTKPKGPTMPKGATGASQPLPDLDWNTDPRTAEQILHRRGLI